MDLAKHLKHLKPRLRALLSHYGPPHDKSTAAAGSPSHRHRRRGRLTAWALPLALLAGVALLLNVFAPSRAGGLRAAGGTRGAALLPSRAVKQMVYDCGGGLGSGSSGGDGCAASQLLVLQTSDGRGGYARMLDAMQGVQLAYAQQWGFSYLRWGASRLYDVGGRRMGCLPIILTHTHVRADGLAKGRQAWHATYNRIYLLNELYRLRHQHRHRWVLFMDPGDEPAVDRSIESIDDLFFPIYYPPKHTHTDTHDATHRRRLRRPEA